MRPSIKRRLEGLLAVGAVTLAAVGADARGGGCSPCYFVGINPAPGGSPEGGRQEGGFQADTGRPFRHDYRNGQPRISGPSGDWR